MANSSLDRWPHDGFQNNRNGDYGRHKSHPRDRKALPEFFNRRRDERERIGEFGSDIWGQSPSRIVDDSDQETEVEKQKITNERRKAKSKSRKRSPDERSKKKHKHKSLKKKSKKRKEEKEREKEKKSKKKIRDKKHRRKMREVSSNSSDSLSAEDSVDTDADPDMDMEEFRQWVEKRKRKAQETEKKNGSDDEIVGPLPKQQIQLSVKEYGKALLPGEGAAMAAFVQEGKRIPRRGEIGLTSDEIDTYEKAGYVMSGSRHRRMEAVRMRKENQIYSADEKRALAMFSREERSKRENKILSQFREMISKKLQQK